MKGPIGYLHGGKVGRHFAERRVFAEDLSLPIASSPVFDITRASGTVRLGWTETSCLSTRKNLHMVTESMLQALKLTWQKDCCSRSRDLSLWG